MILGKINTVRSAFVEMKLGEYIILTESGLIGNVSWTGFVLSDELEPGEIGELSPETSRDF